MPLEHNAAKAIFLTVLEKATPEERAAYLDQACAGDVELRQRIEALLRAHDNPDSFLEVPALDKYGSPADDSPDETEALAATPPEREAGKPDFDETQDEAAVVREYSLGFLQPPGRPDSLGRLKHYEVLEVLGKGGFGTVLKAFDEKLHRIVAIKVMAAELATSGSARQRFLREARAAAAVRHENVVDIHAVDEEPLPYLVMECVLGLTLQDKLNQTGPLEVKEVLRIGQQIACGLAAAHRQGLIHRDIKPANILLENGVERVKITDFGLARAADDASVTQSGAVAGTPAYMSPEQAEGLSLDHRSDLFSLGSTLYVMCTGRPPFRASGTMAVLKRVCEETPRPIREINAEIPDWLCAVINRLHAKKPEDRFQSAQEVADLLEQHLAHLQHPSKVPLPAIATPVVPSPGHKAIPWNIVIGLCIASVLFLAVGLPLFMFNFPSDPAPIWQQQDLATGFYVGLALMLLSVIAMLAGARMISVDTRTTIRQAEALQGPGEVNLSVRGRGVLNGLLVISVLVLALVSIHSFTGPWQDPGTRKPATKKEATVTLGGLYDRIGLEKVVLHSVEIVDEKVRRVGQPIAVLKQEPAFLKQKKTSRATLPPGKYQVEVVCQPGYILAKYEITRDLPGINIEGLGKNVAPLIDLKAGEQILLQFVVEKAPADLGWVQLFNKVDLTGWEQSNDWASWNVVDGELVAKGKPRLAGGAGLISFLTSRRHDYLNFHLRAQVKIGDKGNSGIWFRLKNGAYGYEAQINSSDGPDTTPTGSLLLRTEKDTTRLGNAPTSPVPADTWFPLEVIADGPKLTVKINNVKTAEVNEGITRSGPIALECHPNTIVHFRTIEIKELPPTKVGR